MSNLIGGFVFGLGFIGALTIWSLLTALLKEDLRKRIVEQTDELIQLRVTTNYTLLQLVKAVEQNKDKK